MLVHVSTAFVNCQILEVQEKIYPPGADWRKMIEVAENCEEMTLKALTEKILDGMPNTYTFTKNLGEHCIHDICKGRVPLMIARPTIGKTRFTDFIQPVFLNYYLFSKVVATMKDPVPGWIDNFNGPCGILVAYGKGNNRSVHVEF